MNDACHQINVMTIKPIFCINMNLIGNKAYLLHIAESLATILELVGPATDIAIEQEVS